MRFLIKSFILLIIASACWSLYKWRAAAARAAAWAELLEFETGDVQKLSSAARSRAKAVFERFAPLDPSKPGAIGSPWTVCRVDPGTERERIIILRRFQGGGEGGHVYPAVHATLLSPDGEVLGISSFIYGTEEPAEVEKLERDDAGGWCLRFSSGEGDKRTASIYGPRDQALALLRVEDAVGAAQPRPLVSFGGGGVGAKPSRAQPADWLRPLQSSRPADVLETLSWLSARFEKDENDASPYAYLDKVRADKAVRSQLQKLKESTNDWIADAADLALRP